jgi:hypothetical protein
MKYRYRFVLAISLLLLAILACTKATPTAVLAGDANATELPTLDLPASPSTASVGTPEICRPHVRAAAGGDGALNLRDGPGTSFQVLVVLADGDRLEIVQRVDGWTRVKFRRGVQTWDGYVNSVYIEDCK